MLPASQMWGFASFRCVHYSKLNHFVFWTVGWTKIKLFQDNHLGSRKLGAAYFTIFYGFIDQMIIFIRILELFKFPSEMSLTQK